MKLARDVTSEDVGRLGFDHDPIRGGAWHIKSLPQYNVFVILGWGVVDILALQGPRFTPGFPLWECRFSGTAPADALLAALEKI